MLWSTDNLRAEPSQDLSLSITVHCSTFIRLSLHVTVQKQRAVHTAGGQRWELYFSPIKYAIPIPISSPKLLPFSTGIPWEWEFPFPCTPLPWAIQSTTVEQDANFVFLKCTNCTCCKILMMISHLRNFTVGRFLGCNTLKSIAPQSICTPIQNDLTRKQNYNIKTVDDLTIALVTIETWLEEKPTLTWKRKKQHIKKWLKIPTRRRKIRSRNRKNKLRCRRNVVEKSQSESEKVRRDRRRTLTESPCTRT